jgi:hypothetical protein
MNPVKKLQEWVKSLPPSLQTAYYAVETATITGTTIFAGSLYTYYTAHNSFAGFDWHGQLTTLKVSVVTAALKAGWDLLKQWTPFKSTPAAPPQIGTNS